MATIESSVIQTVAPVTHDLGDFKVNRTLPGRERTMVGPFIFIDEFGPARLPSGQGMDVRPHPHINLATVTYLFQGEIVHRDSLGSHQSIRPGEINWMTAGRGIVHSERSSPDVRHAESKFHGLQLWVALPRSDEEITPAFHHYAAQDLPAIQRDGSTIRVLIGNAYGIESPVRTLSPVFFI